MPRRAMLPYPSTSRRLCATTRCPRITTIALVSVLFACLYNSRKFLTNDQPTLNRVVNSAPPPTILEPAVEVVKEVVDKSDNPILALGNRDTSDGIHTVYNNLPRSDIDNQPLSDAEPSADTQPVSATDLDTNLGEKDLVGLIADAQKDETQPAVSETIPTAEKTDDETLSDPTTTALEHTSADGQVSAAENQEDADTTTESVTSQSGLITANTAVLAVEKQESSDDTKITGEQVNGVDSKVVVVEKQESSDEISEGEPVEDGEDDTSLITTTEKLTGEGAEQEEVETTDKQEVDQTAALDEVSDKTEKAEIDPATEGESNDAVGEEIAEDGLNVAEKQDGLEAGETDAADVTTTSEKQTETAEEAVSDSDITVAEKQEGLDSETEELNASEKEEVGAITADKTEKEDRAVDTDLSGSDKMADEQSIEEKGEDVDPSVKEGDNIDAEDKQVESSEAEEVTQEKEGLSETSIERELDTAEKDKDDDATSMQEAKGDYGLSAEDKQEVQVDRDDVEKEDDEKIEALNERRR